jgi:hypothetical protein
MEATMSYNGSGTFQINTSGQPVVTGTIISSTAFNSLTADLATGLSTAITKDGQTATTVRIPFAQGISSTLATDSTSTGTGSIITAGGVGIAKALYVGTTANVAGAVTLQSTLAVGGVATFSITPIFSALTASSAVATDASKNLVSVTNTGTGDNVLATSPTITTPTISTITSAAATDLTLKSAGTTAITVNTNQALGVGSSPSFGTSGQVLTSAGTAAAPTWSTPSSSVQIQPISASVSANALTISASALTLYFRSTTLGSGTVTTVSGTPANLVISSGSTLGTVSAQQSRIIVIALNNAGTIELAAVNISGGTNLDETTLISTTAEGGAGAADSATVVYSTTARTSLPFRVVGFIQSTQATAGTWATAPSTIQGYGGQALAAMSSLGYGQTWQNLTGVGGRASGTTLYNTTGRPIIVQIVLTSAFNSNITPTVNGVSLGQSSIGDVSAGSLTWREFMVPPNQSYLVTTSPAVGQWNELR